ncbi:MAG: hypothetical protein HRT53_00920 [Colwellia sp.]|nr:hypothetical protein [Colwellia sp.]
MTVVALTDQQTQSCSIKRRNDDQYSRITGMDASESAVGTRKCHQRWYVENIGQHGGNTFNAAATGESREGSSLNPLWVLSAPRRQTIKQDPSQRTLFLNISILIKSTDLPLEHNSF